MNISSSTTDKDFGYGLSTKDIISLVIKQRQNRTSLPQPISDLKTSIKLIIPLIIPLQKRMATWILRRTLPTIPH
jgi:hypothetical protein